MTRIASRKSLDEHLDDEDLILLLLFEGAEPGGDPRAVHDLAAESVTQEWRATLLLPRSLLQPAEAKQWKAGDATYVVLGEPGEAGRPVAATGKVADLLLPDGSPSVLAIRKAFTLGEKA